MKDANKRRRFSSLFLNLAAVSKKSTPVKFTYIWHFERNTINAKKFEKTQIHWRFPAAVAFVDAKHPQYNGKEPRYGEHITPVPWPIRVWNVLYNTDPAPTAHRPPPPPPPTPSSLTISFFVVSTHRESTVIISMVNKHKNAYSHFCSEHQRSGP